MKDQTPSNLFYFYQSAEEDLLNAEKRLEEAKAKFEKSKRSIKSAEPKLVELLKGVGVVHGDKLFRLCDPGKNINPGMKEEERIYLRVDDYVAPQPSYSLDSFLKGEV